MSEAEIPPTVEPFSVRAVPPVIPRAEAALAPATAPGEAALTPFAAQGEPARAPFTAPGEAALAPFTAPGEPGFAPAAARPGASTALPASRPPAEVTAQGHRPGRGDIRTAALSLLSETDRLGGYRIVQLIAERSSGVWQPSAGAVYPALRALEAEALVEQVEDGARKGYRLTDAGRAHAAEHRTEAEALWQGVASAVDPRAQEIDVLCEQVVAAVRLALHDADDERYAGTRRVLSDARRSLYRMLAEEPDHSRG
ncbi:PadR family transcriptional regulator [Streptomyces sp. NPDC048606]|uniref:PadR family transcriptional regulator n=1 Tax=Streptomyces sp. NPDC048606 TaxID=3154726 RepID=UPI003441BCBD